MIVGFVPAKMPSESCIRKLKECRFEGIVENSAISNATDADCEVDHALSRSVGRSVDRFDEDLVLCRVGWVMR